MSYTKPDFVPGPSQATKLPIDLLLSDYGYGVKKLFPWADEVCMFYAKNEGRVTVVHKNKNGDVRVTICAEEHGDLKLVASTVQKAPRA